MLMNKKIIDIMLVRKKFDQQIKTKYNNTKLISIGLKIFVMREAFKISVQ